MTYRQHPYSIRLNTLTTQMVAFSEKSRKVSYFLDVPSCSLVACRLSLVACRLSLIAYRLSLTVFPPSEVLFRDGAITLFNDYELVVVLRDWTRFKDRLGNLHHAAMPSRLGVLHFALGQLIFQRFGDELEYVST